LERNSSQLETVTSPLLSVYYIELMAIGRPTRAGGLGNGEREYSGVQRLRKVRIAAERARLDCRDYPLIVIYAQYQKIVAEE
jgi:hypothetical protein